MNNAVESAIARIWESYSEPLSLADIAKSAILSRFHFSRVFRDATGVSPGRFLSAVRIYQAKRLLVSTSLSVTDISLAVGYNSLGSFTNRFTESVGTSPTRFRRIWLEGLCQCPAPRSLPPHGTVTGLIEPAPGYAVARVFVGAFETPIIQRRPVSSMLAEVRSARPTIYRLENVPPGEWFLRAVAVADSIDPEPWTRRSLLIGGQGSVTVVADAVSTLDVSLRTRRPTDLPILFAVPGLEREDIRRTYCPDSGADAERALAAAFTSQPPGEQVA